MKMALFFSEPTNLNINPQLMRTKTNLENTLCILYNILSRFNVDIVRSMY